MNLVQNTVRIFDFYVCIRVLLGYSNGVELVRNMSEGIDNTDYRNLRYSDELCKLSDAEIAQMVGYTERAVAHWNSNKRSPNPAVFTALRLYIDKCRLEEKLDAIYDYYR